MKKIKYGLFLILCFIFAVGPVRAIDSKLLQQKAPASVMVLFVDEEFNPLGTGSGTFIGTNGYILTNFHCVGTNETGELYNSRGILAIGVTDDLRKPPVLKYIAQYLSGDPAQDVAVVKVIADINGKEVEFPLPVATVELADSDTVYLGDEVNVIGYPGVGGNTVTFTSGKISGFLDEDNDGNNDWLKTDALVNHGNSGGTALNALGQMVAIPTQKLGGQDNDIMFYLKPVNQCIPSIKEALGEVDPQPTQGATLAGRVLDEDTGSTLANAVIILLKPGISTADFLNAESSEQNNMYQSLGQTDANGQYKTRPPLPKGYSYSVIIACKGYEPLLFDSLEISSQETDYVTIEDVYLTRAQ